MTTQPSFPNANEQMLFLTEGEIEMFSCVFSIFDAGGSVGECMCVYTYTHTHTAQMGYTVVSPGIGIRHLESRKNPDRLKRSIHVDRIGVHSTFVYIYTGLRALMIWTNCLFSFNMSFLLRKVEDVTTISKSQSLTLVSIKTSP